MQDKIYDLIEIYYEMSDGQHIKDFQSQILIKSLHINFVLKYKILKHIVESRKKDNYSKEKIKLMFSELFIILENKNYKLIENKKEDNSKLFVEINFEKEAGLVLVLEIFIKDADFLIRTAFFRSATKIKKIIK